MTGEDGEFEDIAILPLFFNIFFFKFFQFFFYILQEVADDREEDGEFEDIPILPLTPVQMSAIENSNFQALMKVIGLQSPQTEQEMFWRVPSRLSVDALRKRGQFLKQGIEGSLPEAPESVEVNDELPQSDNESHSNNVPESGTVSQSGNVRQSYAESPTGEFDTASDSSDDENIRARLNNTGAPTTKKPANRSNNSSGESRPVSPDKRFDSSSSDSDKENNSPSVPVRKRKTVKTPRSSAKRKSSDFDSLLSDSVVKTTKKRRIVMDDSDDEDLPQLNTETFPSQPDSLEAMDVQSSPARNLPNSEDHESNISIARERNSSITKTGNKSAVVDSDSEDESNASIGNKLTIDSDNDESNDSVAAGKKSTVLDSDSDDAPTVRKTSKRIIDSDDELSDEV